jgi:putative ABC transport system permease protein
MKRLRLRPELHVFTAVMRTLLEDLRFALRLLTGSPGFTLVATLTLALGIACTATVFTWMDSLLLHPFHGANGGGELAVLEMQDPSAPNGGAVLSWLDYTDYRDHLKSISGLALQRYGAFTLGEASDARLVWGELVSAGYFETLGVRPLLGQLFVRTPNADIPGAYPVAVISERLWRAYFDSDRRIIGKTIHLNRRQMTVVGVAPGDFHGTAPALMMDLWVPAAMGVELGLMGKGSFGQRDDREFSSIVVRLKPDVSLTQARAEVKALAATFAVEYPKTNKGVSATMVAPWRAHSGVGEILLAPLSSLMGVAVLLLLVVCANVSNLLLARSVARHREFGIRIALGASRWRVARQLMTETLLLGGAAAIGAFILLTWMQGALISMVPSIGLPLAYDLPLNFRVLGFTVLICLSAALVSGLAPALVCFSPDLNEALKEGGRRASPTAAARNMRGFLVVAEVALAAVALIGAGLFLRSFRNARSINPGFDTSHVLFARFFIESTGYSGEQIQQLMLRLRQNLEAEPGVEAVSYSDFTPLSTTAGPYADNVRVDGYVPPTDQHLGVNDARVAPGYLAALKIPILEGRDFTLADVKKVQPVMIVNQAFADRFLHGQNPVGHTVVASGVHLTVVGLARDSKYFSPAEPARPFMYIPFSQFYDGSREVYLFLRTRGDPARAISTLRRVVNRVDPTASAYHAVPLEEYTQVSLLGQNVAATLMSTLGLMCLLLAAIGIYSVMAYAVSQRTQEIGIRIAMGASSGNVIGMVVRQGMSLALVGLSAGIAAALVVTRAIGSMLIHVSPADLATFAGTAVFLASVSFLAAWLPAVRATHIDPVTALRRE